MTITELGLSILLLGTVKEYTRYLHPLGIEVIKDIIFMPFCIIQELINKIL